MFEEVKHPGRITAAVQHELRWHRLSARGRQDVLSLFCVSSPHKKYYGEDKISYHWANLPNASFDTENLFSTSGLNAILTIIFNIDLSFAFTALLA